MNVITKHRAKTRRDSNPGLSGFLTSEATMRPRMFDPEDHLSSNFQVFLSFSWMVAFSAVGPGYLMTVWTFSRQAWMMFSGKRFLTRSMSVSAVVTLRFSVVKSSAD